MEIRSGQPYPAGALSNFAAHPFTLDKVLISSMEGFLQSLKFSNPDMQAHICTLVGFAAKKAGAKKNWQRTQTLYWREKAIKRESEEYNGMIERAYTTMFEQNMSARKALLATNQAKLTHTMGRRKKNETVLTQREFCGILTQCRQVWQLKEFVVF